MKINELINIETTLVKGPYENFKTKYGSKVFKVGRLKDWQQPAHAEGNFESAEVKKGVPKAEWEWKQETPSREEWTTTYSYQTSKEEWVELTWFQNKNLQEATSEIPCRVIPRLSEKSVKFEVVATNEPQEPKPVTTGEEITEEDLPF